MSRYQVGGKFERRVRTYYERKGFFVVRSAGSHGPVDLVALKKGEVLLVQCKVNGQLSRADRGELVELAGRLGGRAVLVWRGEKPRFPLQFGLLNVRELLSS